MLALWITGGILLVLLILLIASVRLDIAYNNGEIRADARYLLLRIRLFPRPGEKICKKAEKKGKKAKQAEEVGKEKKAKKSAGKQLEQVRGLLSGAKGGLETLRRHTVLYKVKAEAHISREDAHQTALAYAKTTSFVAVFVGLLDWLIVLKKPDIYIAPDFTREKSVYVISFRLRLRPLFALIAGIKILYAFMGVTRRGKPRQPKHIKKGGQQYESAASNR